MICSNHKLSLRYIKKEDLLSLHNDYYGDVESSKYLARKNHVSIDQTKDLLAKYSNQKSLSENGIVIWVIEAIENSDPVGVITLIRKTEEIEIHVGVVSSHTQKGYASVALKLSSEFCISSKLAKAVISYTDITHVAAQKTFLKAGFTLGKLYRKYYVAPQLSSSERDVYLFKYPA